MRQPILWLLAMLVSLGGGALPAVAMNTYTVSPGQSISAVNPVGGTPAVCSAASGWLTIPNAAACVHVTPSGTSYVENVNTTHSGSAGALIVYICDTQYGCHLVQAAGCNSWTNSANFIVVGGFDMTGTCSNGISSNGSNGLWIGNRVHDLPGAAGFGGIVMCQSDYTCHDNVVERNIVDAIGPLPNGSNLIHGIYMAGPRFVVKSNIVSRAAAACITTYHGTTNGFVSNNTLVNCGRYGIQISADGSITTNDFTAVDNNIIVNSLGFGIQEFPSVGTHNKYNNNIVYNNASGNSMVNGTLNNTTTLTTAQFNALFVSYNNSAQLGNFNLQSGSAASGQGIGSPAGCAASPGLNPCTPTVDFAGTTIGTPSIGAYTAGGGGTPVPHLEPPSTSFADQIIDAGGLSCSATKFITLSNTGTASFTVTSSSISDTVNYKFAGEGTCFSGLVLAPATSCTNSFKFCPTTAGAKLATFTDVTTAASPTAGLSGNGITAVPLPPSNLTVVVQ